MLDLTYGPFFWLHTAYSYTLLAGGTFLLLKEWRRASEPYARQSGILLVGVSVPWLTLSFTLPRVTMYLESSLTPNEM